jgi:hypothetical protein
VTSTPSERREAIERQVDRALGSALFSHIGRLANTWQKFAYLSYLPDSIRRFSALPELPQLLKWWTHQNASNNSGDIGRLILIALNARQVLAEGVSGDFAEVGVYKGNSARVLADALDREGDNRKLYLFDTFGGFDRRDFKGIDAEVADQFGDISLEAVQQFVGLGERFEYRPGYFPDSANGVAATFALVHLDCDLYEPMKAGLEFFYPRLSPGGLMLLHDYSSRHWPGATNAVDEFLADKPEAVVLMPDKSGTASFRKV